MSHFSVNGIETSIPIPVEASFKDLITFLKKNLVNDQTLISSVRVNGYEVFAAEEAQLASTPISELKSVEILTTHPKDLADSTLQNMIEFTKVLENLSKASAEVITTEPFYSAFTRLIEGITTLTDGISNVKQVLKISFLQPVNVLEADLLSILQDLQSCQESRQFGYMKELLDQHLPLNFQEWREIGIPALLKSRDS